MSDTLSARERAITHEVARALLSDVLRRLDECEAERDMLAGELEMLRDERRQIRAQVVRGVWGAGDSETWMDDPLVWELTRIVDRLLELDGPMEKGEADDA